MLLILDTFGLIREFDWCPFYQSSTFCQFFVQTAKTCSYKKSQIVFITKMSFIASNSISRSVCVMHPWISNFGEIHITDHVFFQWLIVLNSFFCPKVGGGLSSGYSILDTAFKEAEEEASIPSEFMLKLKPCGSVSWVLFYFTYFISNNAPFPTTPESNLTEREQEQWYKQILRFFEKKNMLVH